MAAFITSMSVWLSHSDYLSAFHQVPIYLSARSSISILKTHYLTVCIHGGDRQPPCCRVCAAVTVKSFAIQEHYREPGEEAPPPGRWHPAGRRRLFSGGSWGSCCKIHGKVLEWNQTKLFDGALSELGLNSISQTSLRLSLVASHVWTFWSFFQLFSTSGDLLAPDIVCFVFFSYCPIISTEMCWNLCLDAFRMTSGDIITTIWTRNSSLFLPPKNTAVLCSSVWLMKLYVDEWWWTQSLRCRVLIFRTEACLCCLQENFKLSLCLFWMDKHTDGLAWFLYLWMSFHSVHIVQLPVSIDGGCLPITKWLSPQTDTPVALVFLCFFFTFECLLPQLFARSKQV